MGSFRLGSEASIQMVKMGLCWPALVLLMLAETISGTAQCSNRCNIGATGWCGERRKNSSTGAVQRCADRTRYGQSCASACGKGEKDYHWCWVGWHLEDDWEYCAPEGETRYGVACLGECAKNGTSYWWCYTDEASEEWEYCSPPGEVLDTAYTVNGQDCIGECATQGEDYWWCKKSPRTQVNNGKTNARDADWDYCSPNPQHTRYNKTCSDACESRGEKYYWCNVGSSWDYCSPAVETVEKVIAKGGGQCVGKCDSLDENYTWCHVINVDGEAGLSTSSTRQFYWDYCDLQA